MDGYFVAVETALWVETKLYYLCVFKASGARVRQAEHVDELHCLSSVLSATQILVRPGAVFWKF